MLDIIFISYDEPNADKHFERVITRFPHAQRVHGVEGIAQAHFAASKLANTKFFYVVDGDAEILDSFKFDYCPPDWDSEYVHIWSALNPALGIAYGYGGVKLFNRKMFRQLKSELDFSTTISSGIKLMDEIACYTRFNSDALHAFRGALRETVKLTTILRSNRDDSEKFEAVHRLRCWENPVIDCDFREYIIKGAEKGILIAETAEIDELVFINDPYSLQLIFDITMRSDDYER